MPNRMLPAIHSFRARKKYRKLMTGTFNRIARVVPVIRVKRTVHHSQGNRILEKSLLRNATLPRILHLVRAARLSFRP